MSAALETLSRVFGYTSFRGPQQDIIDTVSAGGDALVLMPTGGGKSLCYQLPALLRDGCGVVISPLIALMADQVGALRQLGVRAACLNSALGAAECAATEQALLQGELDLVYVAPERLTQERTLALLQRARIALFAIDEAHCVSQWGHDFRADYLRLDLLAREFPGVPRIALTATADERTRAEIARRLELESARHFIAGFDRPNIRYRIGLKHNPKTQLLRFLREEHPNDAGIIYCLSRRKTQDTAQALRDEGFDALPYHAGLEPGVRAQNQARFLREDGVIMVATIAFGMGIDKPDVRFVAHLDMPKTVEAYYQETGRAGRDGEAADAWMVYGLQDVIKLRQMMASSEGSEAFRRAEQHRLNAMLGLCEITTCRRQALLAYFGETLAEPCGNCDTCLEPPATWDGTEAAQKALSATYRTGQRFGVNHLIDVLLGKTTDKAMQFDHQHLPTFGTGTELDGNQWRSVFRQLVGMGYLAVDIEGFGALRLQEKCRPLLRGEEQLALREDPKPVKARSKKKTAPLPEDVDPALFEVLRECRRNLAEEQNVPPYMIFHDRSLKDMCAALPRNEADFAAINGVGASKLEKYSAPFLAVIADHLEPGTEMPGVAESSEVS
ncbi:MAG: DNA helicase RecQ [Halioglobus sp.]|nr:DNA helicase RecQ [Halioglobus sp.]